MKLFYIKTDKRGYIRDIIEEEHENYKEIQYNDVLPTAILAGWYKWNDGKFILDENRREEIQKEQEKNNQGISAQIRKQFTSIQQENELLKDCILEICDMIYGGGDESE